MVVGDESALKVHVHTDEPGTALSLGTAAGTIEGVEIAAKYGAPRAGDVRDSQADTSLAVSQLGHAPQYSFEQGMRATLEWYRANRYDGFLWLATHRLEASLAGFGRLKARPTKLMPVPVF